MTYDEAVTALYQAPVEGFVTERKRLAAELKTAGDKSGATKLAKLGRPTLSAWTVNQLWWHARDAFDKLFEAAGQIRDGELGAQPAHREALATLRGRAARILTDGGHNANEGTLRRITTTLSALTASGSWSPDAPGSLAADRDPIGFDIALSLANVPVRAAPAHHAKPAPKPDHDGVEDQEVEEVEEEIDDEEEHTRREAAQKALETKHHEPAKKPALTSVPAPKVDHEADKKKKKEHDEAKRRAHEEAEHKKAEDKARAAKAAERSKLIANLATAQSELARRHKVVTQLAEQLGIAEQQVAEAEDIVAALQAKLEEHA